MIKIIHKLNKAGGSAVCYQAYIIALTDDWKKVTCKNCLKKREGGKDEEDNQ